MYIQEITLKNFRNYDHLLIKFSPDINYIVGENGVGKTNIIESISITSNLKSFRNIQDADIIQWEKDSYYCASVVGDSEFKRFEVGCSIVDDKIKKKVKIDGSVIKNSSQYYGRLLTVVFSPLDINIINGPPDLRRRFIDSVISKIDLNYMELLGEYKKILNSRNALLKELKNSNIRNYSQLEIWDRMLSEKACRIMSKRIEFIEEFAQLFSMTYKRISGEEDIPKINYCMSANCHDTDAMCEDLVKCRRKDIILGSTSIGPQRDDYIFNNDRSVRFTNYASQGQRRTAAISLKISEFEIIEKVTGKKCIILVDDIFSELDEKRRTGMIDVLKRGNQMIFTMVYSNTVKFESFGNYKSFTIEPGGHIKESMPL